ncbi:MAG: hypothetical protein V3U02_09215 [Calditrichia bacterium]
MTLDQITEKKIQERIDEFHFYRRELGLETAKDLILENTTMKPVVEYVQNYKICI